MAARDIVEGHVLCMRQGRAGQKYIFSTSYMTMDEIMDLFEEVTGRPKSGLRLPPGLMAGAAEIGAFVHRHILPRRRQLLTPGAVRLLRMGRRADTGKAQRELGYRPTSIAEAVREAYEWFVVRGVVERPSAIGLPRRPHGKTGAGAL